MTYLRLFWEFFKTGLFAVGGGMATVPFLNNIGLATGWYSQTDLMNMLAVSESTPGPIGINMATYVGFTVAGIPGAVIATIGEVTPSIIVILIVAAMLTKFRNSKYVENAFYGLRPASSGLIGAACAGVVLQVLLRVTSSGYPDCNFSFRRFSSSCFLDFSTNGTQPAAIIPRNSNFKGILSLFSFHMIVWSSMDSGKTSVESLAFSFFFINSCFNLLLIFSFSEYIFGQI